MKTEQTKHIGGEETFDWQECEDITMAPLLQKNNNDSNLRGENFKKHILHPQ
jgi:hypothetical protein